MGVETQEMYLWYTALAGKVFKRSAVGRTLDKDNVDSLLSKLWHSVQQACQSFNSVQFTPRVG
jgi:hypothetical protein